MTDYRHNQSNQFNPNLVVPGLPVYEDMAGGLIELVSRIYNFFSRLGK